MRILGSDHAGLEKVCGMLNLPKPMTAMNFGKISNVLCDAAKVVAGISMNNAVLEQKHGHVADVDISVDGTWQRVDVSLNGLVAAISIATGKIIDVEVMS